MTHPAIPGPAALLQILLLLLLALMVLLLSVPVDLEGRISRGGGHTETWIRIGWLFGRLKRDVSGSDAEEPPDTGGEERPEEEKDEKEGKEEENRGREEERSSGQLRVALAVLRTDGFPESLVRLMRGLFGTLQVRTLSIDMRIGLSDPAETGEAVGLLAAVLMPLKALSPVRARIVPSFAGEEIAGSVEGGLRIWPIKALPPIARFLLSSPAWRAGWRAASARWGAGVLWKKWPGMRPLGWIEKRKSRRGKW